MSTNTQPEDFVSNSEGDGSSQFPPNRTQQNSNGRESNVAEEGSLANLIPPPSQSLRGPQSKIVIPGDNIKLRLQQFPSVPLIEQRLVSACEEYDRATVALSKSRQQLDRLKSIGEKQGRSKQLPASLRLKLLSNTRFIEVPGDEKFYDEEIQEVRQLERETSDRFFDIIVKAREKHIKSLEQKCSIPKFVTNAANELRPNLEQMGAKFNKECGVDLDPNAAPSNSQVQVRFPTEELATQFEIDLRRRLMTQAMARADSSEKEEKKRAEQVVEDHKSQEKVLAGAHTGETINDIANKAIDKRFETWDKNFNSKFDAIREMIQKQLAAQGLKPAVSEDQQQSLQRDRLKDAPSSRDGSSNNRGRGRGRGRGRDNNHSTFFPHDYSNNYNRDRQDRSSDSNSYHNQSSLRGSSERTLKSNLKRKSESDRDRDRDRDHEEEHKARGDSHSRDNRGSDSADRSPDRGDSHSSKRLKASVTILPKNGEGGDRDTESTTHSPRSSSKPRAVSQSARNNANQKERGNHSDESQEE